MSAPETPKHEARQAVTIVNGRGLHARASAKFVGAVDRVGGGLKVSVQKDGQSAAGGSILGLMMLGAARGDTIEIAVTGDDPASTQDALAELCALVEDGFGEE